MQWGGWLDGKTLVRGRTPPPPLSFPNIGSFLAYSWYFWPLTSRSCLLSLSPPDWSVFPPGPAPGHPSSPLPNTACHLSPLALPVFLLLGPDRRVTWLWGLPSRTTAFGFLNALCKLAAVLGISIFTSFVGITKAAPILFASAALALGSSLALKLPETRGQVLQ